MKVLVDIGHPAHVHLFKNMIWERERKGHEILITAREKEITSPCSKQVDELAKNKRWMQ